MRLWLPDPAHRTLAIADLPAGTAASDLDLIRDTTEGVWSVTTLELYGSGLLAFHVLCDRKGIPEHERAPVHDVTLKLFVSTLAGIYNGDTIRNYVYGIRAWHILHSVPWTRNTAELDTLIRAALRLTPPSSKRPPRSPWTPEFLRAIKPHLAVDSPLGAAVWACATMGFFSLARLGELTMPMLKGFRNDCHVARAGATPGVD